MKNIQGHIKLDELRQVFFVGIGGIGMSALARYFHQLGRTVSGYDKTETVLTKKLVEEGIQISYKDQIEILDKAADLVVYTPAIPDDHQGLTWYRSQQYPVYKRAEVLAMISNQKKSICIAGTHGKTSTSSMVTYLLRTCGQDVSAFIGGIPTDYGTNFLYGESDWVVMEADEYDRSFWQLSPDIASIMSMDADHLDIYGSYDVMREGFEGFIDKVSTQGLLLIRHPLQDDVSAEMKRKIVDCQIKVQSFGIDQGDIQAQNVTVADGRYVFDYVSDQHYISAVSMQMPGRHNIDNALVAMRIALERGCDPDQLREAMGSFSGIRRRFQVFLRTEDHVMIDDYAHHPTELRLAIDAARTLYSDRKITGVFQPHLYSRTRDFYEGFAESLDMLDECILLPIYPARELPIPGVTSEMIYREMKLENKIIANKDEVVEILKERKVDILMILGAGDIDTLPVELIQHY